MKIKKVKRPWNNEYNFGIRPRVEFYHTSVWRKFRQIHINGTTTLPDGRIVSNAICLECYLEGKTTPVHTVDHIHRIRAGGDALDLNNLQSLCKKHHNKKCAQESLDARQKILI
jgi:5-methylcytosine-specific restriction endonuclease McrA